MLIVSMPIYHRLFEFLCSNFIGIGFVERRFASTGLIGWWRRDHCNLLGIYLAPCSENYEECIGAKKHLVIGVSLDNGPDQESNAFAQRWKRSSGDGVAISAGMISLVAGK
jgi:hypothetical protein